MPIRVEIAIVVSTAAQKMPIVYPISRTRSEVSARPGRTPLAVASANAESVDVKVGNSSGLPSHRA